MYMFRSVISLNMLSAILGGSHDQKSQKWFLWVYLLKIETCNENKILDNPQLEHVVDYLWWQPLPEIIKMSWFYMMNKSMNIPYESLKWYSSLLDVYAYYWKLSQTAQETNELQIKLVYLNKNKNKLIAMFFLLPLWMSNNAQNQMLPQV